LDSSDYQTADGIGKQNDKTPVPRILHVDDDVNFLELFKFVFSKYFDIMSVDSGSRGIEKLAKYRFDLVITDYEMPGVNGIELLTHVKSIYPELPVIFYTGQGNEEIAREAFVSGASDYFVKNFSEFAHKEKLVNSVIKLIEKSLAETAFRDNEHKYREIFRNLSEGVTLFSIDENGDFESVLEANYVVCRGFGKTHEELIKSDLKQTEPDTIGHFCTTMSKSIKENPEGKFEYIATNFEGKKVYLEIQSHKFKLKDKDVILIVSRDISEQVQVEKQVKHLNKVLKSLRNINQIITKEKNAGELIGNACRCLSENNNYANAWIALVDENQKVSCLKGCGEGIELLQAYLTSSQGSLTPCMAEAMKKVGTIKFTGELSPCRICPPVDSYDIQLVGMITRLEYEGKLFGFLKVSLPADILADEEEESLFIEIAEDLSYAIHNIEVEKCKNKALEDLRISEKKYHSIFNEVSDCIFIHDAETGEIIDFNRRVPEFYGYAPDEVHLFRFRDIMIEEPEYTFKRAQEIIQKSIDGETQIFEWKAKNKQGEKIWVEVNLKKIMIGNDERLVSVVREIDHRKKIQEKLQESETRYRSLFNHIADGFVYIRVVDTDENGIPSDFAIVDMNDKFVELTGQTREELLSIKTSDMLNYMSESIDRWNEIINRTLLNGEEIRMDYYFEKLDAGVSIVIYSPEKDHVAVVFPEITKKSAALPGAEDVEVNNP
jgi:PAS domain S-box-containing protein